MLVRTRSHSLLRRSTVCLAHSRLSGAECARHGWKLTPFVLESCGSSAAAAPGVTLD
jgi:hypothetical protein